MSCCKWDLDEKFCEESKFFKSMLWSFRFCACCFMFTLPLYIIDISTVCACLNLINSSVVCTYTSYIGSFLFRSWRSFELRALRYSTSWESVRMVCCILFFSSFHLPLESIDEIWDMLPYCDCAEFLWMCWPSAGTCDAEWCCMYSWFLSIILFLLLTSWKLLPANPLLAPTDTLPWIA